MLSNCYIDNEPTVLTMHNLCQHSFITLYNNGFRLSVKPSHFCEHYGQIKKSSITPPYSLENYICDGKKCKDK